MKPAARHCALLSLPALALVVGGCSIQEQTQVWYPRYYGVTAEAGPIGLRDVVIVASEDDQATILATFANEGPRDELVEVRIGEQTAQPTGGALEIPPDGSARLGPDGSEVHVSGVDLTPGLLAEVEFRFANAPRVTVDTVIAEAEGIYENISFPDSADTGG